VEKEWGGRGRWSQNGFVQGGHGPQEDCEQVQRRGEVEQQKKKLKGGGGKKKIMGTNMVSGPHIGAKKEGHIKKQIVKERDKIWGGMGGGGWKDPKSDDRGVQKSEIRKGWGVNSGMARGKRPTKKGGKKI